jgi:hypothetical protein
LVWNETRRHAFFRRNWSSPGLLFCRQTVGKCTRISKIRYPRLRQEVTLSRDRNRATAGPFGNWGFWIRLPVTFDTCEVIEERWANWLRQDPVVAIETPANNLRRLKALYIDCGEKDQFNLLYGARRFVRRLNELGIAHRYDEFPNNHTGVDNRMCSAAIWIGSRLASPANVPWTSSVASPSVLPLPHCAAAEP